MYSCSRVNSIRYSSSQAARVEFLISSFRSAGAYAYWSLQEKEWTPGGRVIKRSKAAIVSSLPH
jgi:hypothetical protein